LYLVDNWSPALEDGDNAEAYRLRRCNQQLILPFWMHALAYGLALQEGQLVLLHLIQYAQRGFPQDTKQPSLGVPLCLHLYKCNCYNSLQVKNQQTATLRGYRQCCEMFGKVAKLHIKNERAFGSLLSVVFSRGGSSYCWPFLQ